MRLLPAVFLNSFVACSVFGQGFTISTFAGGALPINIPAMSASIGAPQGTAVDVAGNVFFPSENVVFRIDAKTGILTVVAGNGTNGLSGDGGTATSAQLASPIGVAVDSAGNLYIADLGNSRVRKLSNGLITTVAGGGGAYLGDGGPATSAQLNAPYGVAVDSAGNLYIADFFDQRVRKVSNGVITTIAGNGTHGAGGDGGPATSAQLSYPTGVAVDSAGNLYIADSSNYRVRKVANGVITTVAGGGNSDPGDGGPATSARLSTPNGVSVDSAGNLYIAEIGRIRKVSNNVITTLAGDGFSHFSGDGGPAINSELNNPRGLAVDSAGNLYIADSDNHRVRKISNTAITTVAGNGDFSFGGDGGPATSAQLASPRGVGVDSAGNLYIADYDNYRVRKVSNGLITTVAGNGTFNFGGDGGPATSAQLSVPTGVAVDSAGNLYIADQQNNRVRKVSNGVITTVAGGGSSLGDNGPATSAQLSPYGLAVDNTGNLYIADISNNRIRKVSNGVITTVAGNGMQGGGGDGGPATSAQLSFPTGVAVDSIGNLYIADNFNNRIRKVSNGVITTVAGNGTQGGGGDGGPAISAQLSTPYGVAVDSAGNLYIADYGNSGVRKVSNGVITTIAGGGSLFGDNGPATSAQLYGPEGVAIDANGKVYIADYGNFRIRSLTPGASCTYTVSPTTLQALAGGGSPTVNIQTAASCPWTVTGLPNWITVSGASSGTGSGIVTLIITANTGAARTATISVAGASITVAQQAAPTSSVSLTAVQNAASYNSGQVAPGEIVLLLGSGMGPTQLTQFQVDSRGYVPTQLAGTQILFNGIAAPIIYTRSDVVAAIVPYGVTGNTANIVVQYQGQSSSPLSVPVVGTVPGLFTAGATGSGQAAAVNQDGSYNTVTSPAKVGSVISLYATGEGQTSPAGVDGKPAGAPLPQPLQSVFVTVGGVSAEVDYAGGAPTLVAGVMQLNVRIPTFVQPGNAVPVVVKIANSSSQVGVTIAVTGN